MRSLLVIAALTAAPSLAADPLHEELEACGAYCADRGQVMLGLKSARFDSVYGRACVCKKAPSAPARREAAAPAVAAEASADLMRAAPIAIAGHGEAPSDEGFAVGSIDCDSAAVRACLSRPTRYRVPVNDLPARLPKGGQFDVTIVEVSDFECPFCARAQNTIKALEAGRFGPKIRWVFAHNPLSFHRRAMPAAIAAEAARQQGKFWPMHDLLFANPKQLGDDALRGYAASLGLDLTAYDIAVANPATRQRIEAQAKTFQRLATRGTPNFYINGRLIRGAQPQAVFEKEIRFAIADAQRLRQRGINDSELVYRRLIARGATQAEPEAAKGGGGGGGGARPKPPAFYPIPASEDPIRGAGKWPAPAVMVIFGDYQCPFCKRGQATVRALQKKYGDQLYVIHRHLPLAFHERALPAAKAAEAAGRQGKFWAMSDLLYANSRALSDDDLLGYAKSLGLNTSRFLADMESADVRSVLSEHLAQAKASGSRGTPTFFVNGQRIGGAQPQANFEAVIDAELAKAKALLKAGLPKDHLYRNLIGQGGN